MKELFSNVFSNKRVLVTGHTGFKGGWLSLWLSRLGADVYGYSLDAPTNPSLFVDANISDVMVNHEIGDVRDRNHLQAYMSTVKPEFIFHLAAQPLVRLSYDQPVETYEINVMGVVNLLEAIRHIDSVSVCQVITSDKCYENREWVYAYRESDPMGGYDPYSNSKGCAELVVSSYRQSYFNPRYISEHKVSLSTVRAGNVIGGGDWALDRIIPDCIRALAAADTIEVRNPHAIRPWQHVLEPLSGYLWLAAKQYLEPGKYEEGWNFGPTGAGNVNVMKIVEQVIKEWDGGSWHSAECEYDALHEAKFLKLDITKASSLLDWRPISSVTESVANTISWYRNYQRSDFDIQAFTAEQIENYCDKAKELELPWAK